MYAWVSVVFIGGLFEEDLSGSRTEGVEIVYSASCLKVETNIGEQNLTKSNKYNMSFNLLNRPTV